MVLEYEILEELKKIREAVSPKLAPPPPEGFWNEFRDFLGRAGVLGLAIGFIMGSYVSKVVSALVTDVIMPVPGAFLPGGEWRKAVISIPIENGMNFAIGDFVGVMLDFSIVVVAIFAIARYARRLGLR